MDRVPQFSPDVARLNDEQDPRTNRQTDPLHSYGGSWRLSSVPNADVDVLVVDDDWDIRSTWTEILQNAGYSVAMAEDGDVALRLLGERGVGLVLLDLRMPRRDGLSVLGALGAKQLVVLVSAYSLDKATRARTEASVVTYLEKPIEPGRLLDVVATTLGYAPGHVS